MDVVISPALDLEWRIKRDIFFGAGLDVDFLAIQRLDYRYRYLSKIEMGAETYIANSLN